MRTCVPGTALKQPPSSSEVSAQRNTIAPGDTVLDHRNLKPLPNELPSAYAERIGNAYIAHQSLTHKKRFAQYFTPVVASQFMAGLVSSKKAHIKIADLGAGSGILGSSICEFLGKNNTKLQQIELTAYEIDEQLIPILEHSLTHTKAWLKQQGIALTFCIKQQDFIMEHAFVLDQTAMLFHDDPKQTATFDVVISNPPYFKLNKSDPRAKATLKVIHGQPNIYALFMAIAVHLLNEDGELIFITPRSYAAGPYFRVFREHFFTQVTPTFIHLFGARNKAFAKDDVLQEHIILKAKKLPLHKSHPDADHQVLISSSQDLADLRESHTRIVPTFEVIDMQTRNKVVRIPLTSQEDKIIKLIHSWRGCLNAYGLQISTGPVVPFRARELIVENGYHNASHIPLLWMQNIKPMTTTWPVSTRKQQYMLYTNESKKLLIKNSNYVLIRRFSAKEERQRLVVAPYLASHIQAESIGLENHLNYIYRPKGELSREEVYGLAALYNSKLLDIYFRTFSGNTQVSATEIKDMPLPNLALIARIGRLIAQNSLQNTDVDAIVTDVVIGSGNTLFA